MVDFLSAFAKMSAMRQLNICICATAAASILAREVHQALQDALTTAARTSRRQIATLEELAVDPVAGGYIVVLASPGLLRSGPAFDQVQQALAACEALFIPLRVESQPLDEPLRGALYIELFGRQAAGLAQLVDFFQRELEAPYKPRPDRSHMHLLRGIDRRDLRRAANRCLDEATFDSFLFDAEISPGILPGHGAPLHGRLIALLLWLQAQGRIEEFGDWLLGEKQACITRQLAELQREDQALREKFLSAAQPVKA